MNLQICHSPASHVDFGETFCEDPRESIEVAVECGAKYLNLWIWWTALFHPSTWFRANAWKHYHLILEWCNRYNLAVIGKFESRVPEYVGVAEDYRSWVERYAELAEITDSELRCLGYMAGNEPRQLLIPKGEKFYPIYDPRFNPHPPALQAEICAAACRAVRAAIRPEALLMTPAHMDVGWDGVPELLDGYLYGLDEVDYLAVNAYPLRKYRGKEVTDQNYGAVYRDLLKYGLDIWPSEQGIHPSWGIPEGSLETMIEGTETFSDVYSHFYLKSPAAGMNGWAIIRSDGSINQDLVELLSGRFEHQFFYRAF